MEDVVFAEHYAKKIRAIVESAHMDGQRVATSLILTLMKEFEAKHIEITVKGLAEYLQSVNYLKSSTVENVIERAETAIKKAEVVLPTPDNVVNLFGKKK